MREFDPQTPTLPATILQEVRLLPGREFPLTPEAIQGFRQAFRARFEGDPQKSMLYRNVSEGLSPAVSSITCRCFFDNTASFFDYLPPARCVLLDTGYLEAANNSNRKTRIRYEDMRHDLERPHSRRRAYLSTQKSWVSSERTARGIDLRVWKPREFGIGNWNTTASADATAGGSQGGQIRIRNFLITCALLGTGLIAAETPGRRETLRALYMSNSFYQLMLPLAGLSDGTYGSA